jgi:hypothetical protein
MSSTVGRRFVWARARLATPPAAAAAPPARAAECRNRRRDFELSMIMPFLFFAKFAKEDKDPFPAETHRQKRKDKKNEFKRYKAEDCRMNQYFHHLISPSSCASPVQTGFLFLFFPPDSRLMTSAFI